MNKEPSALVIAMEACLPTGPLKNLLIYGPRRSGTNYLQQLCLLNTLDHAAIQMDAGVKQHPCRLVSNRYLDFGSKHSLRDRPLSKKINSENTNLVIVKRDLRTWLYSRYAYQQTFSRSDFSLSHDVLDKWLKHEYIDFLGDLSNADQDNYVLLFYEDLNTEYLRSILKGRNSVLTRFPVDLNFATSPGGGTTSKQFAPRIAQGNDIIDSYINSHPAIAEVKSPLDFIDWLGFGNNLSLHQPKS